jgi:PAS domain S-box-containing protein
MDPAPPAMNKQKLRYELQVHQAELEMQNEELRRIQLELETARDRFAMLFDLAPPGYVTLDAEGEIREANLTAAGLLGRDREYLVGKKFRQFIVREDQDRFYLHQQEVYLSRGKQACELLMLKANGKTVPVELESVAIHNRKNLRQECLVALNDITERRRMEAERTQLAAIVESSNDAIISRTPDDVIVSWNRGAEEMFGYPAAEVLGRASTMLLPSDEDKATDQIRQAITDGLKIDHYETERVAKDGRRIWISATVSPVKDAGGRIAGSSMIARDITSQKRAEERLRASERALADFFEESPLGLLWVGPDGRVLRTNRAQLEMLGCAEEEAIGRKIASFHQDPELAADILRRVAGKETLRNYRARLRNRDGSLKHALIDANGFWERGRLIHSRWYVRDVTRRMELEREILAISEREQRRIGRDLHDDLGQQLAGIEFLAQSIARRLASVSPPLATQVGEIAGMARQAMVHTRELAHGLSPIIPEAGGLMIALRRLAESTKRIFRIDCRFHCGKPVLIHDQEVGGHLYRIAQEAVRNALKHGKAQRIDISLKKSDERLALVINDTGIGLAKKPRKNKGMGLGVMQYRAGMIGGSLSVTQRPANRGTGVVCSCKAPRVEKRGKREKHK